MKKPVVDYRKFRLSKINNPEFSHLKFILGWVGYLTLYILTENLIPREKCYVIYSPLDDMIPFCEVFVIPYVFWYLFLFGSLLYFMLYNVDSFKKVSTFILITQIVAMTIYILFPNRQDLRPTEFSRDNVFTQIVGLLYTIDTNTNVCPSLHVGYSLALASVWTKEKDASKGWKIFVIITVVLICMSTAFIKQHSVVDAFVALVMCLFAEYVVYGKSYWYERINRSRQN